MRFLILSQYFHPEIGAPQVRLAALIRHLRQQGHAVEVVTALPNYPQGRIFSAYRWRFYMTEEWEGVKIHRVWLYTATGAGLRRLFHYFSFMLTALWGLRQAQRPDYLLVESPPLFLGITAVWAARRWQIPLIFNVADLWPDSVRALNLMSASFLLTQAEKLERWLYHKSSYINAVTEGIQSVLIQQKRVAAEKVLFLPNGVDITFFRPQAPDTAWRQQLGLPAHQRIILYTGTHGYAHGMEVILQTAQLLQKSVVLFLLVGGGSEKNQLEKQCHQIALNNVRFWGPQPVEIIARLYSLAYAGLSTLRDAPLFEGTRPVKVLTVMACGKPVLYSGAGEGARLVEAAQAGIITPPQDPAALATAIQYLLDHPTEAAQFGKQGRAYVEKHLQWSVIVEAWLQQLMGSSRINGP